MLTTETLSKIPANQIMEMTAHHSTSAPLYLGFTPLTDAFAGKRLFLVAMTREQADDVMHVDLVDTPQLDLLI